ncbi:MAG: adenylyltransferase/cytidyltransferase family protein [Candidatus Levybacteria bacterium]|nr:adenylyltransferase/cytidyltransferase family protein [Candidatus Levybacteria bacterium]
MNNKILNIKDAIKVSQKLRKQNKSIVLVGGFFDILHTGHIKFLQNAKKQGDYLFVFLEDDRKARKTKGPKRPINSQKDRAKILSTLRSVDYVIMLKNMTNDNQYDKIIVQIAPAIIATTYADPYINHKKRQAKLVGGKIMFVIQRHDNYSTSKLINKI